MLDRRYALLGWAVWKVGKMAAKRRVRSMMPARTAGTSPPAAALAVLVLVVGGGIAAWYLFFRGDGAGEGGAEPETVG
jgi:hypothetical protein